MLVRTTMRAVMSECLDQRLDARWPHVNIRFMFVAERTTSMLTIS